MFSINGKQAIIIVNAKCFFLFDITLPTMPKAKEIIPNIPIIIQLNPCKVHSIPTNAQYTLIKEVEAKRMAAMAVGSILIKLLFSRIKLSGWHADVPAVTAS